MLKNTAGQFVAFQAVSTTDGSAVTSGTPTCYYTIEGGSQGTSASTAVHEGNGQWSLALSQAETNGDHIVYTFTVSGAVSQSVNVYPAGISTTATAALEDQYDGTGLTGDTYPATQAQIGNFSTGSAAVSTTAASTEATTPAVVGTPTNDYTATQQLDGTYHSWAPTGGGELEFAYNFDIGANALPVAIKWNGYARSNNDSVTVYARNWVGTSWDQIKVIDGTIAATDQEVDLDLTAAHVNTGANAGDVRIRFVSTGGSIITAFATDRILCSYTIATQSVGYANGAIWFDENAANTNTVDYVDGVADHPVSSWTAVKSLISSLGIKRVQVANGSTVTLDANSDAYTLLGFGWTLALGGQSIEGLFAEGASVTGTATATVTRPRFEKCGMGAVTLGPSIFRWCGFGGTFTAGSAGQFALIDCVSMVAGSGSPSLIFTGTGTTTGINTRRWAGGATYTLDDDCTLSHEVLAGGGTTITSSGANIEVRGITRSLTLVLSNGGVSPKMQFVGTVGPIAISGSGTGSSDDLEINLYGVAASLADTSTNTTVTDATVSNTNTSDQVWDELLSGHADVGSTGAALSAAGGSGDPWSTALPGAYGAGTAGYMIGTNCDAPISTVDGVVDTILVDTNELQSDWTNAGRLDTILDSVLADTDNLQGNQAAWATATGFATNADMLKVPKSDGTVSWNATALAAINAECDTAFASYDGPTNTEMVAAFTEIKGATWNSGTDTLEDILNASGGTAPTVEQIRAEIDSHSTQIALILADTDALETWWEDGGRLDVILDAITGGAAVNLTTETTIIESE